MTTYYHIAIGLSLAVLMTVLAAITVTAAPGAPTVVCEDWLPVNNGAFGMGTGGDSSYSSEEGFEVVAFKDRLYVGMEADNLYGARVWRTQVPYASPNSQADWEEVAADDNGCPFGNCTRLSGALQNDHIDSLGVFNGYLYASTANGGTFKQGTQVWRSPTGDPGTWTQVNQDGFGSVQNTNFKDMQIFQGWLCGGTQNWTTGAQVWCTADGANWVQKNHGGFGATGDVPRVIEVWSSHVYRDALYLGAQDYNNVGRVYRATDLSGMPTWTEVYKGIPGSFRVDILGGLDGYLYISARSTNGIIILRSPSGDPGTWTQVNTAGMDASGEQNSGTVVDGGTLYNGALYVGVSNTATGHEVWRTTGTPQGSGSLVDWVQVGANGLGDPNNIYAELIPFNGDLYAWTSNYASGQRVLRCPMARNIVLMVADGAGANHLAAAIAYYGSTPAYQSWPRTWASTYNSAGSYDTQKAWSSFAYVQSGYTDSAEAATALYTGVKTNASRISTSPTGARLYTIAEKARSQGRVVGAVTTVDISHATIGAWMAHNDLRTNGYAIADEGLWGDPNTTGSGGAYSGGRGPTSPPMDVLIGGGHPTWNATSTYVNASQRAKLAGESGQPGAFRFVERIAGQPDAAARLLTAAVAPDVTRLAGLFGGPRGNLEFRLPDGTGHHPENPTLAEMTQAALTVLTRNAGSFALLVEGGAVDWAAHANSMSQVIGEVDGFNAAVQTVIDWIDRPGDSIDWNNTLVIVTADHETGYLTAGSGVFADQPLGAVNAATLALEKTVASTGRRASWNDDNNNNEIDANETVYWVWNSGGHTNSLVPVYARGAGASALARYASQTDPVRGAYLDNTNIFQAMAAVTLPYPPPPIPEPPLAPTPAIAKNGADAVLSWNKSDDSTGYQVWKSLSPGLNPGDSGAGLVSLPASADTYVEPGVAGTPESAQFYTLRGVNGAGESAISQRIGVFNFALTPGD